MILPIGHENSSVRRIPWVTFVIMVACLFIHVSVNNKMEDLDKEFTKQMIDYFSYYAKHTYLEMDPEIQRVFYRTQQQRDTLERYIEMYGRMEPPDSVLESEQETLDDIGEKLKGVINSIPLMKWGYVPAKKSFVTQFTCMFLHIGWWHLIFNMLFLYLTAPFIEDVWGRSIFIVFYIFVGMMATLAYSMHYPTSTTVLVGASGAVAGVMGAFLVRYWNTRIRFVFLIAWIIPGTLKAPAWLMLPLWLLKEFLSAKLVDSASKYGGGGSGIAHWVHVWGFVFGFLIAILLKFFKVEEKLINPKVETKETYVNESLVVNEEALNLIAGGEKEPAYDILLEAVRKDPKYTDNIEALWNVSLELGKQEEVAPFLQAAMESNIRTNNLEPALVYYDQLRTHMGGVPLSVASRIMLLGEMVRHKAYKEAEEFSGEIYNEISPTTPPGLIISFCKTVSLIDLELGHSNARPVMQMALDHPDVPESDKEIFREELARKPSMLRDEVQTITPGGAMDGASVAVGAALAGQQAFQPPQQTQPPPIPQAQTAPSPQPPPVPQAEQTEPPPIPHPLERSSEPMFSLDDFNESPPLPPEVLIPANAQPPPIPGAVSSPPIPGEPKDPLEQKLEEVMVFSPQKVMKPTEAVPIGLKEGRLAVKVENVGERALPLSKMKAISVVKITPEGKPAYLLIDLFLDHPQTAATTGSATLNIRSLRVTSSTFNPQRVIPNTKSLTDAFRIFTSGVLKLSGATPLPDPESVQLKKITEFHSVKEYEEAMLR
ncbi:MAG: rhomboid family intramembrane serine protease [bacterium]|nr:rhomboid family intramembrane serine protease [bacterium]